MKYSIHGPFEIKKDEKLINRSNSAKRGFWDDVKKVDPSLPSACGCYLFAIRAGKGVKPCYIGLAAKQAFEKECFAPHKINIYNDALKSKKGTPLLFFVAKRTSRDKFVKPGKNGHQASAYLETLMIGAALEKNPELMNIKKTKFLKEICVPCLINTPQGKPTQAEIEFKKTIG